jgi:hypothetical protein
MLVRFTERINYSGNDLGCYFIQESEDAVRPYFRVMLKRDGWVNLYMFKEGENNWTIVPQNLPIWVSDIEPELKKVLEKKINFLPGEATS